jgi:hypothetical protein
MSMFNRQRLKREKLEIYLVYLLLAYRHLYLLVGIFLLAYAIVVLGKHTLSGSFLLLPAGFMLLLSFSYEAVHYLSRIIAWAATIGEKL